MSQIKMLNTVGLTEEECKFVSDLWLGDVEIDAVLEKLWRQPQFTSQVKAEKAMAIRTRYMQLDMIMIGQEMDRYFMGGDNADNNDDF